jgi:hypothetical protein
MPALHMHISAGSQKHDANSSPEVEAGSLNGMFFIRLTHKNVTEHCNVTKHCNTSAMLNLVLMPSCEHNSTSATLPAHIMDPNPTASRLYVRPCTD